MREPQKKLSYTPNTYTRDFGDPHPEELYPDSDWIDITTWHDSFVRGVQVFLRGLKDSYVFNSESRG